MITQIYASLAQFAVLFAEFFTRVFINVNFTPLEGEHENFRAELYVEPHVHALYVKRTL